MVVVAAGGRRSERLRGIEGLRALAALAVLVFHVWDEALPRQGRSAIRGDLAQNLFTNMRIGVTLFFVLSGFLLYRPFAAAVLRGRPMPSFARYLRNRALRILPAYWVILLVTALTVDRQLLETPAHLVLNLLLLQNYSPSTQPDQWSPLGIAPAWSVAVEASFYLALPLLALFAIRWGQRRGALSGVLAAPALMLSIGVAAHLAYRIYTTEVGQDELAQTWGKFVIFNYCDWFAVGMFLAVARILWEEGRVGLPRWWPSVALVAAVVLTMAGAKLWFQGILYWNEYQALAAVAIGLALTTVVLYQESPLLRALEWRPLVLAGLASYSIFLWNDPVIRGLRDQGLVARSAAGFAVVLVVISCTVFCLSALSYRFVERPALARKRTQATTDPEPLGTAAPGDLERPGSMSKADSAPETANCGLRPRPELGTGGSSS